MRKERVAVALSGGVDSSYTACLLRQRGYEVEGVCLDLFEGSPAPAEAAEAGERLGIKVHVFERRGLFQQRVTDYFCRTYHGGRTPNPCAVCNPAVKFKALLEAAEELGAEKAATGHYARCVYDSAGKRYGLFRGRDVKKDQSYFLYRLGQRELERVLFPLGEYTKEEVRILAAEAGLTAAAKRDSQEVCFIPDGDYPGFLRREAMRTNVLPGQGLLPGDYIDRQGKVLGRHQGLACYTVGQRKNLGIALGKPVFVLALLPETNQVVLGPEEALFAGEATTADNCFVKGERPEKPAEIAVKLRSGATPAAAVYYPLEGGRGRLVFREVQRAVTPGQSAVYYQGEQVLGGGVIQP